MSLKKHELEVIADLLNNVGSFFCTKGCSDYDIDSKAEKKVATDMGHDGEAMVLGEDLAEHLEKRVKQELKKRR